MMHIGMWEHGVIMRTGRLACAVHAPVMQPCIYPEELSLVLLCTSAGMKLPFRGALGERKWKLPYQQAIMDVRLVRY